MTISNRNLLIQPQLSDDELATPRAISNALGISEGTLAVWRCTGRYPLKYIKVGKSVKYRVGDVRDFLRNREFGDA